MTVASFRYMLVPLGSMSKIEDTNNNTTYELYVHLIPISDPGRGLCLTPCAFCQIRLLGRVLSLPLQQALRERHGRFS